MKKSRLVAVAIAVGAAVLMAVHPSSADKAPVLNRMAGEDTRQALDLKLFRQLAEASPSRNLCISPLGIRMLVSMSYRGTAGGSKTALAKALAVDPSKGGEFDRCNAGLLSRLCSSKGGAEIKVANAVWASDRVKLKSDFVEACRKYYNSDVATVSFGSPDAGAAIGAWFAKNTRGVTPQPAAEYGADTSLVLGNAVYFSGTWLQPFKPSETHKGNFTRSDGRVVRADFMSKESGYGFHQDDGFQAICLEYAQSTTVMWLVLPGAGSNINKFVQSLYTAKFKKVVADAPMELVRLEMPRFKISSNLGDKLVSALSSSGLSRLFGSGADLSGMFDGPKGGLQEVVHSSTIDVNEQGTRAASGTIGRIPAGIAEPIKFTLDRPFLFVIWDYDTDTILFMGIVADPTQG